MTGWELFEYIKRLFDSGETIALSGAFIALAVGGAFPPALTIALPIAFITLGVLIVPKLGFHNFGLIKTFKELAKKWKYLSTAEKIREGLAMFANIALDNLGMIAALTGCVLVPLGLFVFPPLALLGAPICFATAFGLSAISVLVKLSSILNQDIVKAAWNKYKENKGIATFFKAMWETLKAAGPSGKLLAATLIGGAAVAVGLLALPGTVAAIIALSVAGGAFLLKGLSDLFTAGSTTKNVPSFESVQKGVDEIEKERENNIKPINNINIEEEKKNETTPLLKKNEQSTTPGNGLFFSEKDQNEVVENKKENKEENDLKFKKK